MIKRMIGDFVFECDFLKKNGFDGKVVGFENHSGKTYLGTDVKPLGKIIKGLATMERMVLREHYTKMFTALTPTDACFQKPCLF